MVYIQTLNGRKNSYKTVIEGCLKYVTSVLLEVSTRREKKGDFCFDGSFDMKDLD